MSLSAVAEIRYNMSKYWLYVNMDLFPCLKSLCSALLLTEQHQTQQSYLQLTNRKSLGWLNWFTGLQTYIKVDIAWWYSVCFHPVLNSLSLNHFYTKYHCVGCGLVDFRCRFIIFITVSVSFGWFEVWN